MPGPALGTESAWRVATRVSLLVCLFCLVGNETAATTNVPRYRDTNVIMISIDTLRYDHLGCYGYGRATSENIDRLSERSVVFDNYISQAVLTPVSQMSILTGQYPRVNGVVSFQPDVVSMKTRTLPELLKIYGYTNAAFLSSPEFRDDRYVTGQGSGGEEVKLFSRGFDVYERQQGEFRGVPEMALEWVREHRDEKFFLWLPIGTVHWPYSSSVPEPYRSRFDPPDYTPFFQNLVQGYRGRKLGDAVHADVLSYIYEDHFYGDPSRPYPLAKADTQYIISRYDAGILQVDLFIGRLLSVIDELDLGKKTLIILYSTHGEDLGEHGYYGHYDLYDTEAKNALLLHFPGNEHGGRRFDPQTRGVDIVPTVLDYLGIPPHHEVQGESLLPEIAGNGKPGLERYAYITRTPLFEYVLFKGRRLFVVATRKSDVLGPYMETLREALGSFDPQSPPFDIAIRTNDWKLILRNNVPLLERISWWRFVSGRTVQIDEVELYDLNLDPWEQTNVASQHPNVVADLKRQLEAWDATVRSLAPASKGQVERLRIPYP